MSPDRNDCTLRNRAQSTLTRMIWSTARNPAARALMGRLRVDPRFMTSLLLLLGLLTSAFTACWVGAVPATARQSQQPAPGYWPIPPPVTVIGRFAAPNPNWLPGHRGVDLFAADATPVLAPADGVITFAGMVGGTAVVVVDHGPARSTLQPVTTPLAVGTSVAGGVRIGRIVADADAAGRCELTSCLHWGLKRGTVYLDPLILVGDYQVKLLPLDRGSSR